MACLLFPAEAAPAAAAADGALPGHSAEDLQLARLAEFMSPSHYYRITAEELCALFTEDAALLAHRQAVLADLLEIPALEGAMERLLGAIDGWESRGGGVRRGLDSFAVGVNLEDFSWLDGCLKKIAAVCGDFSALPLRAEGLLALRGSLETMRNAPDFLGAEADFRALCAGHVSPSKMRLGYNLDGALSPSRLKLLSMEPWTGDVEGGRKKAGRAAPEKRRMMLTQRAAETSAALLQRAAQSASQAINGFVLRETAPLRGLKRELVFYLAALKLCRAWDEAGLPHCFPRLLPGEEKAFSAKGLFNPLLVLGGRETVVTNDIEFAPGGEILILTGANQGGKTVFLLSVALCQFLAQLGLRVPAAEAALSPAREILTVFAPNSRSYARRGLLAEEAERIAMAVGAATPDSLVLFNEPLTSTGPSETKAISAEVIAAFKAAGVRGVWVTHVYELAARRAALEAAIPWGSRLGSLRIVMREERGGGSASSYRVERGEPAHDSHAFDVLRRKGVSLL